MNCKWEHWNIWTSLRTKSSIYNHLNLKLCFHTNPGINEGARHYYSIYGLTSSQVGTAGTETDNKRWLTLLISLKCCFFFWGGNSALMAIHHAFSPLACQPGCHCCTTRLASWAYFLGWLIFSSICIFWWNQQILFAFLMLSDFKFFSQHPTTPSCQSSLEAVSCVAGISRKGCSQFIHHTFRL